MFDHLANYFGTTGFMPHGHCFFWTPSLLWIYVVSDFTIAASYFSIPFALWYFVEKRPDVPFRWIFVMFGAFVLACGTTHLFAIWNIWHADYWADAGLKALTASVSAATAILLWPLIPKALTIPSHLQLENANRDLHNEVMRRQQAESALLVANDDLERRIAERTAELEAAGSALRENEARFRSLTDLSSDWYWEQDRELRLSFHSSGFGQRSGTTSDKLLGKRRWEEPNRFPLSGTWDEHRAMLEAREPFRDFEYVRIGADGEHYFVSLSGVPIYDAAGEFNGYRGVGTNITERKHAEESLRDSEQKLRAIFEGTLDGILVADVDTKKFLSANAAICGMLGYTQEETVGIAVPDIHPKQGLPRVMERFERLLRGEIQLAADIPVLRKDGSVFYADIKAAPIRFGGKDAMLGIFRDVTERKAAEAKIQRLTQLYAALGQCNQTIVRCTSEEELFPKICRVAVEFGGMRTAWIGLVDQASQRVNLVATYGEGTEYLEDVRISVDAGSAFGHGLVGTAMRENRPVWCQDYLDDPMTAPWHERAARAGWGSMATLPLRRNGVVIGAFALLSTEVNPFDEAARDLLVEMATDIGFALDNFSRESRRRLAEDRLRAAEEQFRGLVEQAIAGIFIIQDGKLVYVNPRCAEIVDQGTTDELIGTDPLSWVADADRSKIAENLRRLLDGEAQSAALEFGAVRRDGVVIEVGANAARAAHEGRPAIIGMLQDISEKKRAEERIQHYLAQLETAFMSTVEVATTLSEMRDPYTAGHERRVGKIAAAIGAELGFDDRRIEGLRVAGYLHDIGKITIPAEILSKPGKLSQIEFRLIQSHPQSSYDVLKDVQFPWPVAAVALQHHERIDGSGYPQGLKGDAILLEARILAVADVIEAMSSHRPYRPGLGIDKALAEIERGRGSAYDADVADACLRLFRESGYQLPA